MTSRNIFSIKSSLLWEKFNDRQYNNSDGGDKLTLVGGKATAVGVKFYLLNFDAVIVTLPTVAEVEPLPDIPNSFLPHTVTLPSLFNIAVNHEPAAPALAELLIS